MQEIVKNEEKTLAKNVLVIMVRGVGSNLKFPFAHFATNGITSDQLFPILWRSVEICEVDLGLKVLYITSDGASPNRRFIRLHGENDSVVYRGENIFSEDNRYIYFVSDAPHLLKQPGIASQILIPIRKPGNCGKMDTIYLGLILLICTKTIALVLGDSVQS